MLLNNCYLSYQTNSLIPPQSKSVSQQVIGFSLYSEERVLVHEVVEVSNLPSHAWLVVHRQNLIKIHTLHVGLESDHIFHSLFVVTAKQDLRVVLVLNKHFHGALNQASDCHTVGLVV